MFDANGGNCLSASIASILVELPLSEVPSFARDHGDGCAAAAERWLASRGYRAIEIGFAHWDTFAGTYFCNAGDYCILSGPSNYPDRAHATVGRVNSSGAVELAHDPIPGGCGPLQGWRRVQFIVEGGTVSGKP